MANNDNLTYEKCLYDFDGYCELTNDSCDECDEYEPIPDIVIVGDTEGKPDYYR